MVRRSAFKKTAPVKKTTTTVQAERQSVKPSSGMSTEKRDTSWQSKNFLDVDDDMEFEFLDLK